MTKKLFAYLIAILLFSLSNFVKAQIITDRPTIAPDARIAVEKGTAQVEATAIGAQWGGWTLMQTVVKYGLLNKLSFNAVLPGLLLFNNQATLTPITGIYLKAGIIQNDEGVAVSLVPFVGYNLWARRLTWSVTVPFRIVGTQKAYAAISPFYTPGILGTDLTTSFNWFGGLSTFHELSFRTSQDFRNNFLLLNIGLALGLSKKFQLDAGAQMPIVPSFGGFLPFLGFSMRLE